MELLEAAAVALKRHRITVEQYLRMGEVGVLERGARVELIEGEVIDMAPIGTRHTATVKWLNMALINAVGVRAIVSVQDPIQLSDVNEPEPDLMLLRPRVDFYSTAHPAGADAFLVIEVADSSIDYDLRLKARLYGAHGVSDYWVIDLDGGRVHFHSGPGPDGYRTITAMNSPGIVELPGLPGATIDLKLLP